MHHHRLPDGRYNIVLQGLCRARIDTEEPLHPDGYRTAILSPVGLRSPQPEGETIVVEGARRRIERLLADPDLKKLAAVAALGNLLNRELPTEVLVDVGLMAIAHGSEQRYAALSEPDPVHRAQMFERQLKSMRRVVRRADALAAPKSGDGWWLN